MKYFIAFMLFLLTNCLVPTSISAATNPTNVMVHSTAFTPEKLSFKQKLRLIFSKKDGKKMSKAQVFFLIGAVLILLGIVFIFIGADKQVKIANPNNSFIPNLAGLEEGASGVGLSILGFIFLLVGRANKIKNAKRSS